MLPSRGAIAREEAANKKKYGVMRAKKTYTNPYVQVDMWVDLEELKLPPKPWNGGGLGGGSLGDGANGGSDRAARLLLVKH